MQPLTIFGVGMVGAMAPEIVRLYSLRTESAPNFTWFYCLISLIFAALGGFVSLILPATTLWGAFYTGISTPVVVSTALKKGLNRGDAKLRGTPADQARRPSNTPSLVSFVNAL